MTPTASPSLRSRACSDWRRTPRPRRWSCATCRRLPSTAFRRPPRRSHAQRIRGQLLRRQRRQRHQTRRAGDRRDDELVEVVEHRAREELAERAGVALVGAAERGQVTGAVALVDDRRRVAEADQQEIEQQATGASIAVEERVDLLEACVEPCERLRDRRPRPPPRSACASASQSCISAGTSVHGGWPHPAGKRLDVVLAKRARAPRRRSPAGAARRPRPASSPARGRDAPR